MDGDNNRFIILFQNKVGTALPNRNIAQRAKNGNQFFVRNRPELHPNHLYGNGNPLHPNETGGMLRGRMYWIGFKVD